jgi:hypothetical protein
MDGNKNHKLLRFVFIRFLPSWWSLQIAGIVIAFTIRLNNGFTWTSSFKTICNPIYFVGTLITIKEPREAIFVSATKVRCTKIAFWAAFNSLRREIVSYFIVPIAFAFQMLWIG